MNLCSILYLGDGDLQVRRESNVKKISTVYSVDLSTMV